MTYAEKLKDPRWQKRRLEIISLDRNMCRDCFDTKTTLHVHHIYYEYGCDPWMYSDDALITLCKECHKVEHDKQKDIEGIIITPELQKMGLRAKDFESIVYMLWSGDTMLKVAKDIAERKKEINKLMRLSSDGSELLFPRTEIETLFL